MTIPPLTHSPHGFPLTQEESESVCIRHPDIPGAILTPKGETLAASYPDGKHAQTVMQYAVGVATGEIIAGIDRILACIRFLRFLSRDDLTVNTKKADFAIGIIETMCVHHQGQAISGAPLTGLPLMLEPWQKFIIYAILIFYRKNTSLHLVNEVFIFIPRKNGKTAFISALSWALSIIESGSGAQGGEAWHWNVILDGGNAYYVDLLRCYEAGAFEMLQESQMRGYVWDYSAYGSTAGQ